MPEFISVFDQEAYDKARKNVLLVWSAQLRSHMLLVEAFLPGLPFLDDPLGQELKRALQHVSELARNYSEGSIFHSIFRNSFYRSVEVVDEEPGKE